MTIDPARRLADALGLPDGLAAEPQRDRARRDAPGELWAMMLDTAAAFDGVVRRNAGDDRPGRADPRQPLLPQHLRGAVSGTQEYMAAETLHQLHGDERFDVVVVDTPPSRNALDFLEAPGVLARFLDHRLFRLLMLPARRRHGARRTRRRSRCCGRSARSSAPTCSPTPSRSSRPSPGWSGASASGPRR